MTQISLSVSFKKGSSVIHRDSYGQELLFLGSLANSSVLLRYH